MDEFSSDELFLLSLVDPDLLGYGEPGELTKRFVSEGLIRIDHTPSKHWKASRTKIGDKRVAQYRSA